MIKFKSPTTSGVKTIERSPEVEALAQRYADAGGWFEVEYLPRDDVSFSAHRQCRSEVFSICRNEPDDIGPAVDRLVERAAKLVPEVDHLAGDDLDDALESATDLEEKLELLLDQQGEVPS